MSAGYARGTRPSSSIPPKRPWRAAGHPGIWRAHLGYRHLVDLCLFASGEAAVVVRAGNAPGGPSGL